MAAMQTGRQVIQLPLEPGLICLKGLSPTRLRFEVEYGLERGTTANSFLFQAGQSAAGQAVPPVLVHPPGRSFAESFIEQLATLVPADAMEQTQTTAYGPVLDALLQTRDYLGETGSITIDPITGNRVDAPVFILTVDDAGVFVVE